MRSFAHTSSVRGDKQTVSKPFLSTVRQANLFGVLHAREYFVLVDVIVFDSGPWHGFSPLRTSFSAFRLQQRVLRLMGKGHEPLMQSFPEWQQSVVEKCIDVLTLVGVRGRSRAGKGL